MSLSQSFIFMCQQYFLIIIVYDIITKEEIYVTNDVLLKIARYFSWSFVTYLGCNDYLTAAQYLIIAREFKYFPAISSFPKKFIGGYFKIILMFAIQVVIFMVIVTFKPQNSYSELFLTFPSALIIT